MILIEIELHNFPPPAPPRYLPSTLLVSHPHFQVDCLCFFYHCYYRNLYMHVYAQIHKCNLLNLFVLVSMWIQD